MNSNYDLLFYIRRGIWSVANILALSKIFFISHPGVLVAPPMSLNSSNVFYFVSMAFGSGANIPWALIYRCRKYPLWSHKYFVSCIRRGIGSATSNPCNFKGIFRFVRMVLAVLPNPLNFYTYSLFRIGGINNTFELLYALFVLSSEGR